MDIDDVKNYYEKFVFEEMNTSLVQNNKVNENNLLKDIACIALNKLPPKYIRYSVDAEFYLSKEERRTIEKNVKKAVSDAYQYVLDQQKK